MIITVLLSITVKQGNFDQLWRFFKIFANMLHHTIPSYWIYNNMIISFQFYTCSVSDNQFFWRYSESKTDQSYPIKWGNFDRTWSNFNRTWGNFDRPIKVTPSVNKVNIIIVNKNKLSFLWRLFWVEKHVGECVNKKTKYFYVYIFNISNFDRNFGVTLIAATG